MKAIEIISLPRRKIGDEEFLKPGSAMRYEMRTKSSKATAVGRLRNSAAKSVAGKNFFGHFRRD